MKFPSRTWLLGLGLVVIGTSCWWATRPRSGEKLPSTENSTAMSSASGATTPIPASIPALVSTNGVRLRPLVVAQQITVPLELAKPAGYYRLTYP